MPPEHKLARNADLAIGAEQLKAIFDEYVTAGFTREEALELIKTFIVGTIATARR